MKEQTLKAIGVFNLAYSREFDEQRLELCVHMLSDIHPVTLSKACENLIYQSRFLPTIAEIREECQKISNIVNNREKDIDYTEAWEMVIKAAERKGYDDGLDTLPPLVKKAAQRIGWYDICYSKFEDMPTIRAQFGNIYNQISERSKEEERIVQSIQKSEPLKVAMESNRNKLAELTSNLSSNMSLEERKRD